VAGVRIKVDARRLRRALREAGRDMGDAWAEIGQLILTSVIRNFDAGGRPQRWAPLKHRSGKPLIDTGRLRNSITARSDSDSAEVGTNVIYAATHQFGRGAIPARPFLVLQDEDEDEIGRIIGRHITAPFR
jgi:phage virion morphogenesis protein